MIRIAVVVGSTRPGRRGQSVARWVANTAAAHPAVTDGRAAVEVVDLAAFDLPLLDEPVPAAFASYAHAHTRRWADTVAGFDGFVFVIPEYNHSFPAALKNAIDFLYAEWHDKAAGIVGYGVDGGVRAIEHLRQVLAELRVADVRTAVTLSLSEDFTGDGLLPRAFQAERVRRQADEVVTWSRALHALRAR
ncbi:MAG TPA: NAD(P)H-dependent oxidoreductase [Jiangellales bacterium]|nr:NAD(P)H-dependent oxidoreductase [Jiangellales bacterium]